MLEKKLQQKVLQISKELGILAVKVDSTSRRGWPDLTCILPNGVVLFVELKTETGRLSPLQVRTIEKIKNNRGNAHVIRSTDQFRQLISEYI